ncbi:tRNA (adenosine(37)-N6)-threonylcarbamoyltransferase complex ATPase subunit type 1 TsaE [Desulfobotulus sp.]|jgi:tRNA threonylcarbamoyladenosine biosynthesis protein TsaE|uniref:tRNA (adenosine(37)-N6)-threonylcarbamoyltransferase complex ATPase subunit type 1 TsaE n=1 Tax=Desulfobotulus sp. TaxID=1940337 RepID=UPI002A3601C3|nr:tRNA (adenosine(37)-N6)-threonylcarbamoyltransferase complex ATPase subunit type 1 TsaE [Desulfobotulus sp.]MDY0163029.1 tRNA (adenosine(37)-N6)-threonylcarbamoyltransferase complex ATPase subunit type 1 TsaE [Desulfobotulus sp.]
MSTPTGTLTLESLSSENTFAMAQALGRLILRPCRLALSGDLGAGKTLFVQGFARGLGVPENVYVTSPSYALIHAYTARLPLYHADLYRLGHMEEVLDIGLPDLMASESVTVVEWAERMEDTEIFDIRIHIEIHGETTRKLHAQAYGLHFQDLLRSWQQVCPPA